MSQRRPRARLPTTKTATTAVIARRRAVIAFVRVYLTVSVVSALPVLSPSEQVILTGTGPVFVLRLTVHFQVTTPFESALLSPRPFAVDVPESYSTST